MPRQSGPQKRAIRRVMHAFKHGELQRSRGGKVRNPKQALAIALHEAGASREESPAANRTNLARSRARQRDAGQTKAALMQAARKRGIPGRSRMNKQQLQKALAQ